ncbi:MAG: beta-N-acetylhexosaminidase [Prolixibacteraceae bacterium]|nr:beta-N-acetylhexosaminidase [Prolixibacteraceae bacterium]
MKRLIFFLTMIATASGTFSQAPAIIPQPSQITVGEGAFLINAETTIIYDASNVELKKNAGIFNEYLQKYYGFQFPENVKNKEAVTLKLIKSLPLGDEGYMLKADKKGILITAAAPVGIFYGLQTLKQMLPVAGAGVPLAVSYCDIKDQPRFKWRGTLLDVGRHYFPVSFIKKYIDYMAMYKLNTFHWHLTEDQGWRLEIKKYPELTEISHWRDETVVGHARTSKEYDGRGYGGFYTQDQVRDIVKYAADRYVTVVPEIEMPGHTSAVLAAFPELGCSGGPYQVQTKWGVHKEVFCAGKEETFKFLENVLDEVCALFPSKYIHIGGDECPKVEWEKCAVCQKRIQDEGLKDEHELQSYFIQRMEKYLNSKGRQIIGWDEILEGGLAPGATVMSWRGIKGGIAAAKEKHMVIMSPNSHMYFDYYQSENKEAEPLAIGGFLPLEKVYSYEPVPEELAEDEKHYVLGCQANVWTEYIPSTMQIEYMLFPRVCALAEVAWSPKDKKDFTDFERRMATEYPRLDMYGINYWKKK